MTLPPRTIETGIDEKSRDGPSRWSTPHRYRSLISKVGGNFTRFNSLSTCIRRAFNQIRGRKKILIDWIGETSIKEREQVFHPVASICPSVGDL